MCRYRIKTLNMSRVTVAFCSCPEVLCERLAADVKNKRWRCGYFSVDPSLFERIDMSESTSCGLAGHGRSTADRINELLGDAPSAGPSGSSASTEISASCRNPPSGLQSRRAEQAERNATASNSESLTTWVCTPRCGAHDDDN